MTLKTALRLGRVSNLPTVWSNALAGMVLGGGLLAPAPALLLLVAVSLAYVGGMFLNDAFDAEIDARQRPERPIPAGDIDRRTVFAFGFGMLAAGVVCLAIVGLAGGTGLLPAGAGLVLAALITFYNWHHKENALSPVVMGLCRVLVYVAAALAVTRSPPFALWAGAGLLLCHLIGLTYAAKQETLARIDTVWPLLFLAAPLAFGVPIAALAPASALFWLALAGAVGAALRFLFRRGAGDVPRAVMTLIAAISLLDAMLIAGQGRFGLGLLAALGFPLTLALQRLVRGT
jgi:4-hydroxybenzoate polyprenyltransferase